MAGHDSPERGSGDGAVVAAIDRDDSGTRLVISDVTADGRWLAMRYAEAPLLAEWR